MRRRGFDKRNGKIKRLLEKLDKALDANIISKDDYIEITACLMIVDVQRQLRNDKDRKNDERWR